MTLVSDKTKLFIFTRIDFLKSHALLFFIKEMSGNQCSFPTLCKLKLSPSTPSSQKVVLASFNVEHSLPQVEHCYILHFIIA